MMTLPKIGKPRRFPSLSTLCCAALLGGTALTGCGGGGSKTTVPNPSPGTNATSSVVSGSVSDVNGQAIVGAVVALNGQQATTTQGGVYSLPNVVVPSGQASLITSISATATVNGRAWSGQNTVEVLNGEANTPSVNLVISDSSAQASVSGTVRDVGGTGLAGARVFLSPGPATVNNGGQAFTSLGSFAVYADNNGKYVVPKLPLGVTYTAVASYPGHLNQTLPNLTPTGNLTGIDFAISASNSSPVLPAVKNFGAYSFTFPAQGTRSLATARSAQNSQAGMQAIKAWYLKSRGVKQTPYANAAKMWTRSRASRVTPSGLYIETDLVWDYEQLSNLLGYTIVRSDGSSNRFVDIATLRDPLADRFNDLDAALTPGASYYYNVGRLDTINFPNGSDASDSDPAPVTIQVQPLDAIVVQQPAPNASVGTTPAFSWNAVANASGYQVLVYDRFPDYQSDAAGVAPIWPQDPNTPGTSFVVAPTTQTTYAGPALQSGHTYYVAVAAQFAPADSTAHVGQAISISPIQAFTVR